MNKKRNKVADRVKGRMEKIEGMIPPDAVASEGTAGADVIAFTKVDIDEWANQPSMAGKKKAGTEGDLKHALRKICQSIGTTEWSEFVKAINNEDEIDHMYGSRTDRIGIRDFKIQGDLLLFKSRKKGEEDRSIGRIKNILSEIKL